MTTRCTDATENAESIIAHVSCRLDSIGTQIANKAVSLHAAGKELIAELRQPQTRRPIMTGIDSVDTVAGGILPGELEIIAARPGNGKTSLAMQIAKRAAEQLRPVLFVSLEMKATELVARVLCGMTGVDSRNLRRGQVDPARKAIEDLIDTRFAGAGIEASAMTKAWLAGTAEQAICQSLLDYELIDTMPERFTDAQSEVVTIIVLADQYIRVRGAGQEASTVTIYRKAKKNLLECFGNRDVTTFTVTDGREFWRWLQEDKNYAINTAKQRLRFARAFFEMAVEDQRLVKNPFKARGLTTTQSAAEKEYITRAVVEQAIEHCPTHEWKLLFAMVRSIPTRVPSEIQELTWSDVDWERNRILIHSPKTRHLGKSARLVPIFDTLAPYLSQAFADAPDGDQYIFPTLRRHTNIAKIAGDVLTKAKLRVWPKFFNALRASTETDLMDEYGIRRACQWAGNSPTTAMKNYALVRKTDFTDAGNQHLVVSEKRAAKSDAINAGAAVCAAKSDAERASTEQHEPQKNRQKKHRQELGSPDGANGWALRDLNPRPSRCKRDGSALFYTGNADTGENEAGYCPPICPHESEIDDAGRAELLAIWDRLDDDQRGRLLAWAQSEFF